MGSHPFPNTQCSGNEGVPLVRNEREDEREDRDKLREAQAERERRHQLVERLQRTGRITSDRVAKAMERVPRHRFVAGDQRKEAYRDAPLSIGHGQTISAPHMVAMMLEPADLEPGDRVLEVGGGSGYLAAVAAELVRPNGRVITMELVEDLALGSRDVLGSLGYTDVEIVVGDGSTGYPQRAPYDAIIVSAGAPDVPVPLIEQLGPEGKLVIPIGERATQTLCRITLNGEGEAVVEALHSCRFVPLKGTHGW